MWAVIWRKDWKFPIPAGTAKDTHGFCPVPGLESLAVCQREAGEGSGEGPRRATGPVSSSWRMIMSRGGLQRSLCLFKAGVLLHRLPPSGVWSHSGGMNPHVPYVICCDSTDAPQRVALPLSKIGMAGSPASGDHSRDLQFLSLVIPGRLSWLHTHRLRENAPVALALFSRSAVLPLEVWLESISHCCLGRGHCGPVVGTQDPPHWCHVVDASFVLLFALWKSECSPVSSLWAPGPQLTPPAWHW